MRSKRDSTFDVLEGYQDMPKRKLNIKKATKAQIDSFLRNWRLQEAQKLKQKPILIAGSVLIALMFITAVIKIIEWVFF